MGSPAIFQGNNVLFLKQNLNMNGQVSILSGTVDPSSSATSAPIGSLYLNTSNGITYRKLDAGSTTNWVIDSGPVVGAWTAYTPTFTGFGTVTTSSFAYRQVGDGIQIRGKFTVGTPTAVEARVSLPAGFTSAGTGIIASIQEAGPSIRSGNHGGTFFALIEPSVSYVTFTEQTSGNPFSKLNGNAMVSAADTFSLQGDIPCAGLSGTTAPAVVAINMRYFASATSLSGSLATINYTTKDYDSANAYSGGTFTVPTGGAGKYQVNAALLVSGTIALNNTLIMEIQKNGTVVSRTTEFLPGTITDGKVLINDIISVADADTLRIQVSCSATSPAIVSSNFDNYFSLSKLSS